MSEQPDDFELLMPFVACQSQGGPYDDEAFTAGWRCAEVYLALQVASGWHGPAKVTELPQLDLIAMRWQRTLTAGEPTTDGWVEVLIS